MSDQEDDDDSIPVQATTDAGGYWAEIRLTSQLAATLLVGGISSNPTAAVDLASEIMDLARARVDADCETLIAKQEAAERRTATEPS